MQHVGGAVERLEQIAIRRLGDAWWSPRAAALATAARQDEVRVVFVGQFNAGKSSLVNGLLGHDVLPIGALPTSAAVVEVRRGETRCALRRTPAGDEALGPEAFRALATGESSGSGPVELEVRVPSARLKGSVVFCDTPGVNAMDAQHAEITYGYLPTSDAVVLVLDAQKGLLETDERFLRDHILAHTRERLVVVLTHLDLVPTSQRAAILEATAATLARLGLAATPLAGVGRGAYEPAWDAIQSQILAHRGALRDERVARIVTRVGRELLGDLRRHAERLQYDDAAQRAELEALARGRETLGSARTELRARARTEEARLLTELEPKVRKIVEDLAAKAPGYLADVEKDVGGKRVSARVQADLARACEGLSRDWLTPRLREALGEVERELVVVQADLPELPEGRAVVADGVGAAVDLLVEGAALVLLNFMLPGSYLGALIARVVGRQGLALVLEPLKSMVKEAIAELLGGAIRGRVEGTLREAILALEPELQRTFADQVQTLLQRAVDTGLQALDGRLVELERAVESARRVRVDGEAAVGAQRGEIARDIAALLEAGVKA